MERVRKTFFDPLAGSKHQIKEILRGLPIGSAHPFSPERVLLCRTQDGIDEIDISSYPEDYFFNAVDLGEMGEILLRRMAGFPLHLSTASYHCLQQIGSILDTNCKQKYLRTFKSNKHLLQHSRSP